MEFADKESVENAVALNDSLFKGRQIKVISINSLNFLKTSAVTQFGSVCSVLTKADANFCY